MTDNIIKSVKFAETKHNETNHLYDGKPYLVHLMAVYFKAAKYIDRYRRCRITTVDQFDNMFSVAFLHDTIEDCRITYNDLKKEFNEEIAEAVYALSNYKGRSREERANSQYYTDVRGNEIAHFIKICDRLANIEYSKSTGSRMLEVYRKEYDKFFTYLYESEYYDMFEEMKFLLREGK